MIITSTIPFTGWGNRVIYLRCQKEWEIELCASDTRLPCWNCLKDGDTGHLITADSLHQHLGILDSLHMMLEKSLEWFLFMGRFLNFEIQIRLSGWKCFFRLFGLMLKQQKNCLESKSHINVLTFSSQELTAARNKSPCLWTRRWPGRVSWVFDEVSEGSCFPSKATTHSCVLLGKSRHLSWHHFTDAPIKMSLRQYLFYPSLFVFM